MATSGWTPAATAWSHCARPISPPSLVTMALSDMFWPLNGATRTPWRPKEATEPGGDGRLAGIRCGPAHHERPVHASVSSPSRRAALQSIHADALDPGGRQPPMCGRTPSVARQGGAPNLTERGTWMRGRGWLPGGSLPSRGRLVGASTTPRRGERQGRFRGGDRRGCSDHSRPERRRPVHGRAARDRLHPRERTLGPPEGHRRDVGRRQRADRVLHLRRHPDDVRSDLRSGGRYHRARQPLLFLARALLTSGAEHRNGSLRHQPRSLRAERLAATLCSSTG